VTEKVIVHRDTAAELEVTVAAGVEARDEAAITDKKAERL
jgi:hypothetical protein